MVELLSNPDTWLSLLTLTFMEVILGIDNIIFISIVTNRLPKEQQARARRIGLVLALVFRILLLLSIQWIIGLKEPLFHIFEYGITGKGLILFAGGMFLLAKSTSEIYHKMEGESEQEKTGGYIGTVTMRSIILQIIMLDIVFSFDSILTAVGLANEVIIMIVAVVISMIIMLAFSGSISAFINKHPSIQMLALAFLILIGFMLVLEGLPEGLEIHVPKGYIYFALFFSLGVEMLNVRLRKKSPPKP